MADENQDHDLMRRYLLGQLAEDERQHFEETLMADNDLYNRMLLAEDELVEEYLQGELSESERAGFEASFLSTAEGRKQVSFAKALSEYVSRASASEGRSKVSASQEPARVQPALVETSRVTEEPGRVTDELARASKVSRPVWWSRPAVVPYFRLAAAAVVVLGVGLANWWLFISQSEVSKGRKALAYAYRDQRPLETRISGLNYAPAAGTRGGEAKVDRTSLNRAERILLDAVFEHPGPTTHYALGQLYLAEKKFDEAIEHFEEALKADPNNAHLHSDYGAALLEKGQVLRGKDDGRRLEALARSLEHLNIALELDDSLLEALFNRAVCHEYLFLRDQADQDWRKYLEKDSNSGWADEARERLKTRQETKEKTSQSTPIGGFLAAYDTREDGEAWRIISQNRDIGGSPIENKLLDDYLNLAISGKSDEAEAKIRMLAYAAQLEVSKAGDLYLSNLTDFYQLTSKSQKMALVRARELIKSGHESYNRFKPDEALSFYCRANEIFVREGNQCEAVYSKYPIGHCHISQHKNELALSIFLRLAEECETHQYRWLLAQSLNATANAQTSLRDFSKAISSSTRSLKLSEEIGDINGAAKTLNQLANEYYALNNFGKSLEFYAQSFALAEDYSLGTSHLWRNCFSVARVFNQMSLYAAAIAYQREALQTALQGVQPQLTCRSYTYLGLLYGNRRDYDEATKSIQHAIDIGESLPDPTARTDTIAYSSLQLANVYKQAGDLNKALASYDRAIQLYGELDSKYFNYLARKGRLLCCMGQGGCPSLEQDIERTLALFEEHRAQILEERNRNTYFDAEQNIYDIAIDFQYSMKKDSRKAFEYSELCRARSLRDLSNTSVKLVSERRDPDLLLKTVSRPVDSAFIQDRLPENTQILQYAVLADKLLIWVVSQGQYYTAVENIALSRLEEKAGNFSRTVLSQSDVTDGEASREARELYDLLIKPVESVLDSRLRLCIVPDKILNYLPFSALRSGSGEYFIEKHAFVLSPSSSIFISCSKAAREKAGGRSERLLSVGNPLFDTTQFPDLCDLPSAATEAEQIVQYYNSPQPVLGAFATKARVEREMEKADVIHLALHCVADEWSPLRSKLVLAKDQNERETSDGSDGELQAFEIYKLELSRVRLVVLSACRTAVEKYYGGEGMIGISRPFIARGVPLVVASLWSVDSKATAELMINFHKHRKLQGLNTADALRRAQLDMINGIEQSHRSPYYWASFITIGGSAEF